MKRIFLLCGLVPLLGISFSCGNGTAPVANGANGDTPTEAYKRLFAAVKSGNSEAIKAEMTKKTFDFASATARQMGKSPEDQIKFGMTATTYAETLPTIRDERVKENMGAVEVWNSKDSRWENLPFMIEDGKWKLAWGEAYARVWRSPGRSRDEIEREAANTLSGPQPPSNATQPAPSANR